MKAQIELLGILHIVYSSIGLLLAMGAFVLLSGIGWISGDATAMGVLGAVGIFAALFFGLLSIPGLIAGIGLVKLRSWSRMLAIIVACLDLFSIPFGTALGAYTFYVLMNDEAIRILSGEPAPQPAVSVPERV